MSTRIAVSLWAGAGSATVADVVTAVQRAADAGFKGIWLPQTLTIDALTALAVAAHAVPDINVGTAVVPIQGSRPIPLAQQALTVAQEAGTGTSSTCAAKRCRHLVACSAPSIVAPTRVRISRPGEV